MAKVMLIDGNSLTYRAFFALPSDMATASGQVTNAVFGFTSMLINLFKDHQPDVVVVTFDRPEPTFRHEFVEAYKAGRQETPDILRQQMGLVRKVVETLRLPIVEVPGFEADDVIATLATQARDAGDDVIVVTGDRDAYQLVEDPHVKVLYNRRGVSDYAFYDEAGIKERTGVTPAMYPQYAALRGDPSDNLPGVPGVGEKTAAKLINDYGGIDGIYENLDKLTPKLRANLEAAEPRVRINARATPLVREVPLGPDIDLSRRPWDPDEVKDLFGFLEFRTLWDRLLEATAGAQSPATQPAAGKTFDVALTDDPPDDGYTPAIAAAWAGAPGRSELLGLAQATSDTTARWLDPTALDPKAPFHAHRAKELFRGLEAHGIDLTGLEIDTAVAAYLVDPADGQYLLGDLTRRYLDLELDADPAAAATEGQLNFDDPAGDQADVKMRAAREAVAVARLAPALRAAMEARGLDPLYDTIERPLVRVLSRMERAGVRVDRAALETLNAEMSAEVATLEKQIQELAGIEFKVNSTPQLRQVLFEKLGLQPQKKTKTGYSTDAASLEKLKDQHPIIDALLRYREVEKLRSTYGEGLLAEVQPDDRIRASFNQTVARTGRLSSDQPNLHNIPVRSEEGRRFRRAFIPEPGHRFLVADYNQIELRVIAHLATDPGLIDAFTNQEDIHSTTASRIYGVAPHEVTIAQRSKAKMVSYGLAYGMEAFGLSQRLNIPKDEAQQILDAYFVAFPKVKAYMDEAVAEARRRGYTETLFGRRRQIPELQSGQYSIRLAGERQAMNAGIQGLAADIFKVALVRLDNALEQGGMRSRLVLQVHDEVILEVPPDEEKQAEEATRAAMEHAADLLVPLEVNVSWGDTWADAKG